MSDFKKRWTSFEEMYEDLKKDQNFIKSKKTVVDSEVQDIIKKIENAITGKDFFDCTCKLSFLFEDLDRESFADIFRSTNIYVLVLNAALRNQIFVKNLLQVSRKNKRISELKKEKDDLEILIFLNTVLSLAFFGISLDSDSIGENSIEFLRKNTTDLLKNIIFSEVNDKPNFVDLCYLLEAIIWDNRLHFNENYDSKFTLKLNKEFLFSVLKTSRSLAGITFLSLTIRPAVERQFREVNTKMLQENFSLSIALDSIFRTCNELNERIGHYYRNAPKDLTRYFNIFVQHNERNLIFLFTKICSGFHYQGNKKFFDIIIDKINHAPEMRKDLIDYSRKNLIAFNGFLGDEDNEWTNKLFIISLKTLSVLEELINAKDKKWTVSVAIFELNQWILDVHVVLNKYYIEDDWEKIKEFLYQENVEVEWKSSFFTPLEQEYYSEEAEVAYAKQVFDQIIKAIVAMINTSGGTIIVGLVENAGAIKRLEIKDHILVKNGRTFYDINYDLKTYNKSLDNLRLKILDNLKQRTDTTPDRFNDLINIEPIILRNDDRTISIVKIDIQKTETLFYNIEKKNNVIWASLTKRAQGQNVEVDIREYI